jgi:hypothetical protein
MNVTAFRHHNEDGTFTYRLMVKDPTVEEVDRWLANGWQPLDPALLAGMGALWFSTEEGAVAFTEMSAGEWADDGLTCQVGRPETRRLVREWLEIPRSRY